MSLRVIRKDEVKLGSFQKKQCGTISPEHRHLGSSEQEKVKEHLFFKVLNKKRIWRKVVFTLTKQSWLGGKTEDEKGTGKKGEEKTIVRKLRSGPTRDAYNVTSDPREGKPKKTTEGSSLYLPAYL